MSIGIPISERGERERERAAARLTLKRPGPFLIETFILTYRNMHVVMVETTVDRSLFFLFWAEFADGYPCVNPGPA